MIAVLNVANTGRRNLPAHLRKLVGLEKGGLVAVWVKEGEIRVRPVRDVMAALQAEAAELFSGVGEGDSEEEADQGVEPDGRDTP